MGRGARVGGAQVVEGPKVERAQVGGRPRWEGPEREGPRWAGPQVGRVGRHWRNPTWEGPPVERTMPPRPASPQPPPPMTLFPTPRPRVHHGPRLLSVPRHAPRAGGSSPYGPIELHLNSPTQGLKGPPLTHVPGRPLACCILEVSFFCFEVNNPIIFHSPTQAAPRPAGSPRQRLGPRPPAAAGGARAGRGPGCPPRHPLPERGRRAAPRGGAGGRPGAAPAARCM